MTYFVTPPSNGTYRIRLYSSSSANIYWEFMPGSNSGIELKPLNGSSKLQNFIINKNADGTYLISSAYDNSYIAMYKTKDTYWGHGYPLGDSSEASWVFQPKTIGNDTFAKIYCYGNGEPLDSYSGQYVHFYTDDPNRTNQRWVLERVADQTQPPKGQGQGQNQGQGQGKPRTVIGLPKPPPKIGPHPNGDGSTVHIIDTVEQLKDHLQTAVMIEWGTIPLYLFGRYSIEPGSLEGLGPGEVIRSVVQEEMLHLILAGNMLVAIGGSPKIYSQQPFPIYPVAMPHHSHNFQLTLRKADERQIGVYIAVEVPRKPSGPPEADNYDSIGQFYEAIKVGFKTLADKISPEALFLPSSLDYQCTRFDGIYSGTETGGLVTVTDLKSVADAIDVICDQGEGNTEGKFVDDEDTQMDHYWRFRSILKNMEQLASLNPNTTTTINVVENPLTIHLKDHKQLHSLSQLFDACYCFLLLAIERTFEINRTTDGPKRKATTGVYIEFMKSVIRRIAVFLVQQPYPGKPGFFCAPAFNFYDFQKEGGNTPPLKQIKGLLHKLLQTYGPKPPLILTPLPEILEHFADLDPAPVLPPYTIHT